jgi:cholesterol oxidase
VQVLAHCFGATTFVMSMLGGHLSGVRSAVISQIAADVIVPFYPQRLLAYLRLPAVFDILGIPAVNARATVNDGLVNRIADGLIRIAVPFQREERTRNATSSRITALYGQLYETDQLNTLTFETGLPEMFGEANIAAFKQLALIARRQTIVDAAGNDAYMPHLDRLAIPVSFVHGGENTCFLPESTARTLAKLSARNGAHLYDRHVIPNYGHIDCIFGKTAVADVYPKMLAHLEETAIVG